MKSRRTEAILARSMLRCHNIEITGDGFSPYSVVVVTPYTQTDLETGEIHHGVDNNQVELTISAVRPYLGY